MKKQILILTTLFVAIAITFFTWAYWEGYRVNLTQSAPIGIWKIQDIARSSGGSSHPYLKRGVYVLACPPVNHVTKVGYERGYLSWGIACRGYRPLIKKVAGLPGDRVRILGNKVIVGRSYKGIVLKTDQLGRSLPSIAKDQVIRKGELWGGSEHPESFDSRYFGPLREIDVIGNVKLVWRF